MTTETRSQGYARTYLEGIGFLPVKAPLCPTCGAYWDCNCPPPERKPRRHEHDVPTRKSRARYRKGDGFTTLSELVEWIAGGGWTYWNGRSVRPLHSSWMVGQRLQTLKRLVSHARRALPPDEAGS